MTAILLDRNIDDKEDALYLFADSRLSTEDGTIAANNSSKIRSFPADEKYAHARHYMYAGSFDAIHYLIHMIEKNLHNIDDLYTFIFEDPKLKEIDSHSVVYLVKETEGLPEIYVVSKTAKTAELEHYHIDELKPRDEVRFDGSGGPLVACALRAIRYNRDHRKRLHDACTLEEEPYIHFIDNYYLSEIEQAFKAASEYTSTINANITHVRIPLKSKRRKK